MNRKRPILIIQNNTTDTLPVALFSASPNAAGGINAPVQYKWNITALAVNQLTNLQLQVGTPGIPGFSTIAMTIANDTLSAIIDALNALNVGFFQSVVSAGATFIFTNNKAFAFGSLTINQPTQTLHWITTGSLRVNALGVTSNASIQTVDTRSAAILSSISASGVLIPPFTLPYNGNTIPGAGVLLNGDPLQVTISVAPGGPYSIQLILKQNGVTIINNTQIGTTATFNLFYLFNAVYNFTATVN